MEIIKPQIGEIKKGNKRPSTDRVSRIWQACLGCGKERWVRLSKGKPKHLRCRDCSRKANGLDERKESHWAWKGGKTKTVDGYIAIYVDRLDPYFPMVGSSFRWGGYVLEHRLVVAKSLGRCLKSWEIIHHKDSNKTNNALSNLYLTSRGMHHRTDDEAFWQGYNRGYADCQKGIPMRRIDSLS